MTRVVQLGNYGEDGGGISSVLHEFATWDWPTAQLAFVDTYATDPRLWGVRRMTAAARVLIRNRHSTDVAHLHLSQKGSFIREGLLLRLAKGLGLRTVVTLHGSSFVEFVNRYPRLVRRTLTYADAVASLTRQTADRLREVGVSHVTLIPNAVAIDEPTAHATRSRDSAVTIFAGEVSRRKGIDVLLDAWQTVSATYPEARLEIYGGAVDIELPSVASITAHGRRGRDEVRRAVRAARLLVLPSRAEAFPMSILEAMSAGTAVVATDVGQVREMLNDDALVIPAGNPQRLAQAISSLYADDALVESAARRNSERYESLFSPPVVMAKYEALYQPGAPHV